MVLFPWVFSTLSHVGLWALCLSWCVSFSTPDGRPCWGNTLSCLGTILAPTDQWMCQQQKCLLQEKEHFGACFRICWLVVDDLLLFSFFSQSPPPWYTWLKLHRGLGQRGYCHAHTFYFILKTYFSDTCVRPVHMSADAQGSQERVTCGLGGAACSLSTCPPSSPGSCIKTETLESVLVLLRLEMYDSTFSSFYSC